MSFPTSIFLFLLSLTTNTICQQLSISPVTLPIGAHSVNAVYDGDDSIYILGGYNPNVGVLNQILKFTISTENIELVATLPAGRHDATAIWDGGSVLYFGGYTTAPTSSIRRYIPGRSVTYAAGNLPWANTASCLVASANNEQYYIIGGWFNGNQIVVYSDNQALPSSSRLPIEMYGSSAILQTNTFDPSIYIFGGSNNNEYLDLIMSYNIRRGDVSILRETLPYPLYRSGAVFDKFEYAYIIGGYSPENVTGVLRFNPLTKELIQLPINNFPNNLESCSPVYVESFNRIYLFGGLSNGVYRNQIMYLTL